MVGLFIGMSSVKAEKVPVYMITREGCPACETALKYFKRLDRNNSNLIDLVVLKVFDKEWNFVSDDLETMYNEIYSLIGADPAMAQTPTIVIGDYNVQGFPKDESVVYDAIIDYQKNLSEDKIKNIAKENDINLDSIKEDIKSPITMYIILVLIIMFCGIIGLAMLGRIKIKKDD